MKICVFIFEWVCHTEKEKVKTNEVTRQTVKIAYTMHDKQCTNWCMVYMDIWKWMREWDSQYRGVKSEFALCESNRKSQWNCMTLPYGTEYVLSGIAICTISSNRTATTAAAALAAVTIADPIERCTRNFQLMSNSWWVTVCVLMRFGAASDRFISR